jgi:hypothetical protein
MQIAAYVVALMAAGALAACGSSESPTGATGGSTPRAQAPSGAASAKEVAEEMRGDLDCPPRIKLAARKPDAPVDDVVGVRPGMTYEEAAASVMCTHDLMVVQADSRGFQLQTYGHTLRQGFSARFAEPRVVKTSKDYLAEMSAAAAARSGNAVVRDMHPGQSKWYVGTMGMPGQERVISVAREEWFEAGRNPTLASIDEALIKKYGKPTRTHQWSGGSKTLTWAYDPMGRPVTETSSLYNSCTGNADPDGGVNLTPDCGLVVMAIAYPLRDNPELSEMFQVGVVDQANGYEALAATERNLQQAENLRRANQVEEAAKNADAPQL